MATSHWSNWSQINYSTIRFIYHVCSLRYFLTLNFCYLRKWSESINLKNIKTKKIKKKIIKSLFWSVQRESIKRFNTLYAVHLLAAWSALISWRFPLLCQNFLSFCQCDDDDDAFMFCFQIQKNLSTKICTSEFALIVRDVCLNCVTKGISEGKTEAWIYHAIVEYIIEFDTWKTEQR